MILVSQLGVPDSTSISSSPICSRPIAGTRANDLVDHVRGNWERIPQSLPPERSGSERGKESSKKTSRETPRTALDSTSLVCLRFVAQVRRQRLELDGDDASSNRRP